MSISVHCRFAAAFLVFLPGAARARVIPPTWECPGDVLKCDHAPTLADAP
jgi:hypothetical protein